MENITENNKLIAEFLDWEFDDLSETFETPFLKLVDPNAFGDEQYSCKLQDFELEFHSDWNWLMRVVEKIESFVFNENNSFNVTIGATNYCVIQDSNGEFYDGVEDSGETKLLTVYNACVKFIKWYNEQNKNSESL